MLLLRFLVFLVLLNVGLEQRLTSVQITLASNYRIGSQSITVPHTWLFFHYNHTLSRYSPLSFPTIANCSKLFTLLLLSGDVALNPGPINFGFTNCRSIRNKHAVVADFVSSNSINILGLTETHIRSYDTASFLSELTPPNFTLFQVPRPVKLGGGVGFLIEKSFDCTVVSSPGFNSFEHIVVNVKWLGHCLNFVSVYRPPNLSCSDFCDDFVSFIGFTSTLSSPTIISGDFNIHVDTSSSNSKCFKSMLDTCNLVQHIDFPTHIHGHILDLLITPTNFTGLSNLKSSDCLSDHFCITSQLDMFDSPLYKNEVISFRQYHKIDMDKFITDIQNTEFVKTPASNIDDLYNQYHHSLSSILDKHAPTTTKILRKPAPLWITDKFREAKRVKRQSERVWRRHKTIVNRSRLRRQINVCNSIINKSKQQFYTDTINQCSGDSRKIWKELNQLLHKKSESVLPDSDNAKSLADRFSVFFIDKITRIRDGLNSYTQFITSPDNPPKTFCRFTEMSESDVRTFILSSPTKSCMLDPWPTFLVKDCVEVLLPSVTKLVNLSLAEGIFPDRFKKAIVTPLIKKPSLPKNELKNYRPVSGLCFISKLVERVVASQVKRHVDESNLGNCHQSAYKSGHSTETTLLSIKNDIHASLAKGMPTALVLLDLSAAFDTIDHKGLLDCLSSWFGFADVVHKWFGSYISGRNQAIKVGNTLSDSTDLKFGVPQGSVLGPILFSLYTTPLSKVISAYSSIHFHFYADDTQLYIHLSPNSTSAAFAQLQKCLSDIQSWMGSNKLKLNPEKTEFILFGSGRQRAKLSSCFPIDILGSKLCPTDKVRNLGVVFDSSFTFSGHVSAICKSCFVNLRDFRRIRRHLTKDVAISLANALVSSRLDYCNSLFRSLSRKDLHKLQCIQNTLARIVTNTSKFSHITPVLKSLHWLPVEFRSMFKTVTMVYKYIHTGLPKYFSSHLSLYTCPANTRRSNPGNLFLNKPSYTASIHKSKVHFNNSFANDGPSLWNDLPQDVRLASTMFTFRRQLKAYLFSKAFPP